MGCCYSLHLTGEDEEVKLQRIREKQIKKEMLEFQKQLRKQQWFSELDINGKGFNKTDKKN